MRPYLTLIAVWLGLSACSDEAPSDGTRQPTCEGTFRPETPEDVEALADCVRITGSLYLDDFAGSAADFPALQTVEGGLSVRNESAARSRLASLAFPALNSVGGDLEVALSPALTQLDLSALVDVGGSMSVGETSVEEWHLDNLVSVAGPLHLDCQASSTLALPSLETVEGTLQLGNTTQLSDLSLPALHTIAGDLRVLSTFPEESGVATLSLPLLASMQSFELPPRVRTLTLDSLRTAQRLSTHESGSGDLELLALPALEELSEGLFVGGAITELLAPELRSSGVVYVELSALEALALPSLTTSEVVSIVSNPALASISLPELELVDELLIEGNEKLPTCDAQAIAEQLSDPSLVRVVDNAPPDTCS